ncbi:MAG: family 16 glycoside hydrolase [Candidatus Sumerlaeaceae bacterium]
MPATQSVELRLACLRRDVFVRAIIYVLCVSASGICRAAADSRIGVDPNIVLNRVTPLMYGSCIEDVNHEVYGGLYAQMIFGESFEEPPPGKGLPEGWSVYEGKWLEEPGLCRVMGGAGAKIVRHEPVITDGTVECDVMIEDNNFVSENAGLIVRVQDAQPGPDAWTGYEISMSTHRGHISLGRHRNDYRELVRVPAALVPGRWYRLRVELEGSTIRVFLDNAPYPTVEYTDISAPIASGKVGLRTWHSNVSFRNLRISTQAGENKDFDVAGPVSKPRAGVSAPWDTVQTGDAMGDLQWTRDDAFNSSCSQLLGLKAGTGTVGIANRGLNRWGLTFREGHEYQGYVYLRQEGYTGAVTVALQSADGSRTYARQVLHQSSREWTRHNFTLRSDSTDENARFAIWIDQPGGRLWVDQAYLSGTKEDLFLGLPVRNDLGTSLVQQGLKTLRYGGLMVNAPEYRWKQMIGERAERHMYHGYWYPYSTNGFGIEEFVQFCRAAGFEPVFTINMEETAQDAADLIDYLNAPASTHWGRRRAENGHPQPYSVKYVQIGNEEMAEPHYIERFKVLQKAMKGRDPNLEFIVAAWWEPDNPATRKVVEELGGIADLWDVHVGGDNLRDADDADRIFSRMPKLIQEWTPGNKLKACVLEENGNRHDFQRALGHAHMLNTLERHGDYVLMDCPANCLQPWKQNDNGWDQGQLFFTSGKVWGMPPYYAQQIAAQNYLPLRVAAEVSSPNDELDVTATRSEDGGTLVLKVVNIGHGSHRATIATRRFAPDVSADMWIMAGDLTDRNTPEAPDHVRWKQLPVVGIGEEFEHEFPAHSYTILRMKRKE